jgi:hypothetical protein
MTARALVRNILVLVFVGAFVFGGAAFFIFQYQYAMENTATKARALLAIAQSVRNFTAERTGPLIGTDGHEFHSETVPAFAAQTVFEGADTSAFAFGYRERALNPTNPTNRADGFETGLITRFRADPDLTELSGERAGANENVFYIAKPLSVSSEACLACHSTPDVAPLAMTAKFGTQNGFGWELGEIIGVQVIEVPVTLELRRTLATFIVVFAGLAAVLGASYLLIGHFLRRFLLVPLRDMAEEADRQSRNLAIETPLPMSRLSELKSLADAFRRLRASAALAIRGETPPDKPDA